MKKQTILALMMIFVLLLSACGGDDDDATSVPEPTKAPVEQATQAPADKPTTEAAELRFTYYADGNEAEAMQGILDKFEAANPDIEVVLDIVPYETIDTQLPI